MEYHGFYCAILAEGLEHLRTSVGVCDQWPVCGYWAFQLGLIPALPAFLMPLSSHRRLCWKGEG